MLSSAALIHCADSEAFGWVLVEAMAEGVPVIAAKVDGPQEILEDGRAGILVAAGDVAGFAEALRRVVEDRAMAREFAEKGRRRVETLYSARAMAERVADVYRELVAEKASASN
jgi:glycosyltransferase involved in cell wall biosynthesis